MNRRLALHAWARSSLPTAPTQLVIIMTTHTPLGLVRPASAPTAIDCCRALPPTTPLALLVTVFPAETFDCLRQRGERLVGHSHDALRELLLLLGECESDPGDLVEESVLVGLERLDLLVGDGQVFLQLLLTPPPSGFLSLP